MAFWPRFKVCVSKGMLRTTLKFMRIILALLLVRTRLTRGKKI